MALAELHTLMSTPEKEGGLHAVLLTNQRSLTESTADANWDFSLGIWS